MFNDREMFYPKSFTRKNNFHTDNRIKMNNPVKILSKDEYIQTKIKKRANSSHNLNLITQGNKTNLT